MQDFSKIAFIVSIGLIVITAYFLVCAFIIHTIFDAIGCWTDTRSPTYTEVLVEIFHEIDLLITWSSDPEYMTHKKATRADFAERVLNTLYIPPSTAFKFFLRQRAIERFNDMDKRYHTLCNAEAHKYRQDRDCPDFSHMYFEELRKATSEAKGFIACIPPEAFQTPHAGMFKTTLGDLIVAYTGEKPWTQYREAAYLDWYYTAPFEKRGAHMIMLAGSGHGKTRSMEHVSIVELSAQWAPGGIILDSKGDMANRMSTLKLFGKGQPLDGKLIYIRPSTIPSLNLFDIGEMPKEYEAREAVINGAMAQFDYLFRVLFSDISPNQLGMMRPLTLLMMQMQQMKDTPHATISMLIRAIQNPFSDEFTDAMAELPETTQEYFKNMFKPSGGIAKITKDTLIAKLSIIAQNDTLNRMWSAPTNELKLFERLQYHKAVVIVDISKGSLYDLSPIFARYIMGQIHLAAVKRYTIEPNRRTRVNVYIDEAGPYFDEKTADMLETLRSYGFSFFFAFHQMSQARQIGDSILNNTAIKLAATNPSAAMALAKDMRTTAELISGQRKKDKVSTSYMMYVEGMRHAFSVTVPLNTFERTDKLTEDEAVSARAMSILFLKSQLLESQQPSKPKLITNGGKVIEPDDDDDRNDDEIERAPL